MNPRRNYMKDNEDPGMEKFRDFDRFNGSIKTGRLTEDLLSEVKSLFGDLPESPKVKTRQEKNIETTTRLPQAKAA